MIETLVDKIKTWLKRYDDAIEETDNNYDKLKWLGGYDPYYPYLCKYEILFMISHLEKEGTNVSQLKKEYENINEKLKLLEQKRGKNFRDKLYEELKLQLNAYPKIVDYVFVLDPVCVETENDLMGRDMIEILLLELKNDFNLQLIEEQLSLLDETLKSNFESNARNGYLRKVLKECPYLEIAYYPERFWWRHPSKFLRS